MSSSTPSRLPGSLTAEVFAIRLDDSSYVIYAPLRQAAFIGNARVVEVLEDLRRGSAGAANGCQALVDLLRSLEILGSKPELPPHAVCQGEPEPVAVTLFLTTACNLRCTYCYASAGGAAPGFMTLETARRAIDFVAANAARRKVPYFEVGYHGGGEPTVHWEVLVGSYDYARVKAAERNMELRSSLATNGVLEDSQIDWLMANLRGISLSCDGLPEIHDECRRTVSGKASSQRVIHTLRRLDQAKFPYGIRLTVTAKRIATLAASVDYLFTEFHPESILVEPVYLLGRGADAASAESDAFIEAYRAASARARERGGRIHFSGARLGSLTNHFCGVSRDNFCLSAEGKVTACFEAFDEDGPHASHFFYGGPAEDAAGYVFDYAVLTRLRHLSVENREHCRACFAKWSCAGDCYYKWLAESGGGEFRGSARCHIVRELTKDQILEKICEAGGTLWHAPAGGAGGVAAPGSC